MEFDNVIVRAATWIVPLVFAIVLHEISHGWVANAFGDPTARDKGRLSLNPIRHVDPVGTIALPLVLAVSGAPVFGWAKAVPVVARRLRKPRLHMVLVALAGPGMNLLLAMVATLALALLRWFAPAGGIGWAFVYLNLANFLVINLFLAVFNMLPIPPFDGGHVVEGCCRGGLRAATGGSAASAFHCSSCCWWWCRWWRRAPTSWRGWWRRPLSGWSASSPAPPACSSGNAQEGLIVDAARGPAIGRELAMIKVILIATALIGAVPAFAGDGAPREARVPRMAHFLDWRPDGIQGLYIQAETGRWYYARLQTECPRLANRSNIRFEAAPDGDFDRYSAVRAEGWRCMVASVTESGAPPNYRP